MHTVHTPPLSVVLATTQPTDELRRCLQSLYGQAQDVRAEILVADGSLHGHPKALAEAYPDVIWLREPGASVFRLRALAMSQARGAIIAVTEDHCEVTPQWCARIIAALAQYPDAAAIGGIVENGAVHRLIDWTNFLLIFAPFMRPIRNGANQRISLQANISYKRRVIPRNPSDLGVMEMLFNRLLHQQGEKLLADDQLVVYHVQSHGFFGTFAAHFHNGRSIAGYRLPDMHWPEWLVRLGGCSILPAYLLWLTYRALIQKRRLLGRALACLPLLTVLTCSHAAGELVGYLAGPGRSPQQLR
jgi:hypothetical protein